MGVCKGFLMVKKLSDGTVCVFFYLFGALSWNYTLSRKIKNKNRDEENREESMFVGVHDQKTALLKCKRRS